MVLMANPLILMEVISLSIETRVRESSIKVRDHLIKDNSFIHKLMCCLHQIQVFLVNHQLHTTRHHLHLLFLHVNYATVNVILLLFCGFKPPERSQVSHLWKNKSYHMVLLSIMTKVRILLVLVHIRIILRCLFNHLDILHLNTTSLSNLLCKQCILQYNPLRHPHLIIYLKYGSQILVQQTIWLPIWLTCLWQLLIQLMKPFKLANGEGLLVSHIGKYVINARVKPINLNSMLYVPKLTQNLLFVHRICLDNNCWLIFDTFCLWI